MGFQIERGLFKSVSIDYHAVLGVPVDAEFKDIRKRYLKVVRSLHPDSAESSTEAERQLATELLSKLVNPAYEKLSQDRDRTEYGIILRMEGQKAARQPDNVQVTSATAQELLSAKDPEAVYTTAIQQLAEQQYQSLSEDVWQRIGELSELNWIYLMRKAQQAGEVARPTPQPTAGAKSSSPTSSATAASANLRSKANASIGDQYYRRAEEFLAKNNPAKAILELRDALQAEPNNSRYHGLLGMVYLKQNQATMAKIHLNRALELDPQNQMAQEGKQKLEQVNSKAGVQGSAKGTAQQPQGKPDKPSGGLFGLFGMGKKK